MASCLLVMVSAGAAPQGVGVQRRTMIATRGFVLESRGYRKNRGALVGRSRLYSTDTFHQSLEAQCVQKYFAKGV